MGSRAHLNKPETINVVWCKEKVFVPGIEKKYWNSETGFQIYCATWLRNRGIRFHHSANEREGGKAGLSAKLKGQSKGFPDLVIFGEPMVAIELKVGSSVSMEQADWLDYLKSIGWMVKVCYNFDEFVTLMNSLELDIAK